MPSATYSHIREAMERRQQIICMYNDLHRQICPHTLGYKRGREKVLGYQFAGESSRGLPPDGEWRCMFIDEMIVLEIRDGEWFTKNDHMRPQTCVDDVEYEVFA